MILSPKHIHRLIKKLSDLRLTKDTFERCLDLATLPGIRDIIPVTQPTWEVWERTIGKVDNDPQAAERLLNVIMKECPAAADLETYRDEIKSSREIRKQKIKQAMKDGRCVVFLGPDALKVRLPGQLISFNEYLCLELEKFMKNNYVYFSEVLRNNLGYLAQCYADDPQAAQGEIAGLAADAYTDALEKNIFDQTLFEQLAKLPVKLVINANPDALLFEKLKKNPQITPATEYYDLYNDNSESGHPGTDDALRKEPLTITPEQPFVYNIFGSFQDVDSVLFTESQFMNFINSVIQNAPPLNGDVIREFVENDTYLFLGFDFEQWYFKILFQLFNIKKEDYASVSCGFDAVAGPIPTIPFSQQANQPASVYNREFFEQEFKIYFVSDDITNFITQIVNMP